MNTLPDQSDRPSAGIVGEPVDLDTFAAALGGMPADDDGAATMRRMHAEHLQAATNRPPVPSCPSWCALAAGHDWDSYGASDVAGALQFMRSHSQIVGSLGVALIRWEYSDGAPATAVVAYNEPDGFDNTPDRARQVAGDLLTAASLLERGQAVDRESEVEAAAPKVVPACPSWCTLPTGHDYPSVSDDESGVTFSREHVAASFGHVDVYASENNTGGTVTLAEPVAWVHTDTSEGDLDAGQLRQLAAEVLNAAEVLDRLTR